jgi:hypothetical protein
VGAQRWSEERRMQSKRIGRVFRVVRRRVKRWWCELRGGSSGCVAAAAKTQSERLALCCESASGQSRAQTEGALAGARTMLRATETDMRVCCCSSRDSSHARPAAQQDACRVLRCEGTRSATIMRRELPRRGKAAWSAAMLAWKAELLSSQSRVAGSDKTGGGAASKTDEIARRITERWCW